MLFGSNTFAKKDAEVIGTPLFDIKREDEEDESSFGP